MRRHDRLFPRDDGAAQTDQRASLIRRLRRRIAGASRWQWLSAAVTIAALAVWFSVLHPQALGGRTSYLLVGGESMEPMLHLGDLAVVIRSDHYEVGDVVAYRVPAGDLASGHLIIHRIVATDGTGFVVRGDNVNGPDIWQPTAADIEGRLWLTIPNGGRLALMLRHPTVLPALLAALTVAVMVRRSGSGAVSTRPATWFGHRRSVTQG